MARPGICLGHTACRLFRRSPRAEQVRPFSGDAVNVTAPEDYSLIQKDNLVWANPLHLYRALLRQCTYLPDPAARSYMLWHVKARYRQSLNVRLGSPRGKSLYRKARKGLSLLFRANLGHLKPLERILSLTYGRIGKRRHELMRFLREPNVPMDDQALFALAQLPLEDLERKPRLTDKMRVLIKSQKALRKVLPADLPRQKMLQPDIPKSNSWGRPLPKARAKNIEREWYADVLDSIVAPLPEPEWDRLRDLAVGQRKWEGPIPRRTIATNVSGDTKLQYIQSEYGDSKETHNFTARLMRRLWQRLFEKCPVMRWNEESMQWQVQWGVSELAEADIGGQNGSTDVSMFAGVDSRGKLYPGGKYPSPAAPRRDTMQQLNDAHMMMEN